MSDGLNNARALRVLELINDYRTLQVHIRTHIAQTSATPPAMEDRNLLGYQLISRCQAQAQAILASVFDTGNVQPGNVADTEAQKTALKRIMLDAASRRFKAHKIYLILAAAMRWKTLRNQLLAGQRPTARHAEHLRVIDQRLVQEAQQVTDNYVFTNLRNADTAKGYWLNEDATLSQIQALG